MSANSPVIEDCDFEANGKAFGTLRVPCSTNTSAYGSVVIPIMVAKNGPGPTVLFTGGVHGDEFEGPVALAKFCRGIHAGELQGRVIVVPALNPPALLSGTRLSPIDGRNLNRTFPGKPVGTVTELIAHYVDSVLLKMVDIVVDLHSGGRSLEYVPNVLIHRSDDAARTEETLEAAIAFGAPMVLISQDLESEGLLESAAEGYGKITLSSEMGGGGALSRETVAVAERGIRNVLRHFGLCAGELERPEAIGLPATRVMEIEDLQAYVAAPADGIFEPFRHLGEEVEAGEALGHLHDIAEPGRVPQEIAAARSGTIICRRPTAHVGRGDCVAITAGPSS